MTEEQRRFYEELRRTGAVVVSVATLRPQDLLPKYLDALRVVAPAAHQQLLTPAAGFPPVPGEAWDDDDHEWWSSEDCSWLLHEEILDALNEHAPEGYYFGCHEGDGACIGFFPCDSEIYDDLG